MSKVVRKGRVNFVTMRCMKYVIKFTNFKASFFICFYMSGYMELVKMKDVLYKIMQSL